MNLTLGLSGGPQETRPERTQKRALWAVCSESLLGHDMPCTIQDMTPPPRVLGLGNGLLKIHLPHPQAGAPGSPILATRPAQLGPHPQRADKPELGQGRV